MLKRRLRRTRCAMRSCGGTLVKSVVTAPGSKWQRWGRCGGRPSRNDSTWLLRSGGSHESGGVGTSAPMAGSRRSVTGPATPLASSGWPSLARSTMVGSGSSLANRGRTVSPRGCDTANSSVSLPRELRRFSSSEKVFW